MRRDAQSSLVGPSSRFKRRTHAQGAGRRTNLSAKPSTRHIRHNSSPALGNPSHDNGDVDRSHTQCYTLYQQGKVSAVFGTHTHVVTADEKITKNGTGYITDVGMTGAHDSILGRGVENVLKSFRTQMPYPFDIATEDVRINSALFTIDSATKKSEKVQRICITTEETESATYDSDDGKPEYFNNNF